MAQDVKHTPLPWEVVASWGDIYGGPDNVRKWVCQAANALALERPSAEEVKANAEFIVRACNSHYELLEAAKKAIDEAVADDADGWFRDLKLAVAKAEGRS